MTKIISGKLDFDDVLIMPRPSELKSRSEVNLEVSYITKHSKKRFTGVPVCVSNMDIVGTIKMAKALYKHRMWVALNRFIPLDKLQGFLHKEESEYSFVAMGQSEDELERIKKLRNIKNICIDAANAYTYSFLDIVKKIRDSFPDVILMCGNVCTPEGVENLIKAGADISKCGISNGSFCDTKNKAGIGYNQFSVALECGLAANELNSLCCSDGGCHQTADIVKCLAAGSHISMCGTIFGGCQECNGEWEHEHIKEGEIYWSGKINESRATGKKRLKMYGMSSEYANKKYFGGLKTYRASEGKEGWVEYKGPVDKIAQDIKGGLASCCTYTNTKNLENLSKNCVFTTR